MSINDEKEVAVPAEEIKPEYEIVGVRFKEHGKTYYFDPCGLKLSANESVIVETARGLEYGVLAMGNKIVPSKDVVLPLRPVIRKATADDTERYKTNKEKEKIAEEICLRKIKEFGLGMKLVDVEYTFDNTKLLFYFTADGRVDFRELVKELASIFRTRIELRQIGIRDETKLIGGLGVCGLPFCCKKFLSDFVQVSIKMAKEQNLSLNSQKISGACGRLMCCLRYEHETYEEAIKIIPPVNSTVKTPDGVGIVTETKPLAAEVRVKLNDNEKDAPKLYKCRDVKVLKLPGKAEKQEIEEEIIED